jgi:hypothetical protein
MVGTVTGLGDLTVIKKDHLGWCLWLTRVSLATWETEIGRIVVQSQSRQIV